MAKTTKEGTIVPFKEGISALDRRERGESHVYASLAGAVDVMAAEGDVDGLRIFSEIIADVDAKQGPLR